MVHVESLIEQGVLGAGQRLVEPDLMRELGVGRTVVREALRVLAGDGVIELTPNRGARISRLSLSRIADILE